MVVWLFKYITVYVCMLLCVCVYAYNNICIVILEYYITVNTKL